MNGVKANLGGEIFYDLLGSAAKVLSGLKLAGGAG